MTFVYLYIKMCSMMGAYYKAFGVAMLAIYYVDP